MRITESMLVLPSLYCIRQRPGIITTDLITALTRMLHPTGEDLLILSNRNDSRFSQKVRNLASHRASNGMSVYTHFIEGHYTLTSEGERYLDENMDVIFSLLDNPFLYQDTLPLLDAANPDGAGLRHAIVFDEIDRVSEGRAITKSMRFRERSRKLRDAAATYYTDGDGRIRCAACGFDFEETYGELGKGYIEIHHEKPVYLMPGEGEDAFINKAISRMKPLCPNCHRMLHRCKGEPLTVDQLRAYLAGAAE